MGKRKHDAELVQVAQAVVVALQNPSYRPTLLNPAAANAFDSAMSLAGRSMRAWRGSRTVQL